MGFGPGPHARVKLLVDAPHASRTKRRSSRRIQGERNELELEEDERGQATLYFFFGETFCEADFDVDWDEEDNGDLTLELACDGNCSELDLRMECAFSSNEEEMDCDAEEPFRHYEVEWVRN